MSSHADTIRRLIRCMDGSEFTADEFPTLAQARDAGVALDALLAENQRLREALRWIGTCYESPEQTVEVIAAHARDVLAAVVEE
jgi:hypothetical protein